MADLSSIIWKPILNIQTVCRRHYRFSKNNVHRLCNLLQNDLEYQSSRGSPLTPLNQICLTLAYFGGGTFQHTAGLMGGVSKACSNQTIHRVTTAICQKSDDFIKMPSRAQMRQTSDAINNRLLFLSNSWDLISFYHSEHRIC